MKKLIAVLTSLAVLLAMIPATAFAEETMQTEVAKSTISYIENSGGSECVAEVNDEQNEITFSGTIYSNDNQTGIVRLAIEPPEDNRFPENVTVSVHDYTGVKDIDWVKQTFDNGHPFVFTMKIAPKSEYNIVVSWSSTEKQTFVVKTADTLSFTKAPVAQVFDTDTDEVYKDYDNLQTAVNEAPGVGNAGGDIVILQESIEIDKAIVIDGIRTCIHGFPATITASDKFEEDSLFIVKENAWFICQDLTLDGKGKVKYGVQTVEAKNTPELWLRYSSITGCTEYGMIIDKASARIDNLSTSGNTKGGINITAGPSVLTVYNEPSTEPNDITYDDTFKKYKSQQMGYIITDREPLNTWGYNKWEINEDEVYEEVRDVNGPWIFVIDYTRETVKGRYYTLQEAVNASKSEYDAIMVNKDSITVSEPVVIKDTDAVHIGKQFSVIVDDEFSGDYVFDIQNAKWVSFSGITIEGNNKVVSGIKAFNVTDRFQIENTTVNNCKGYGVEIAGSNADIYNVDSKVYLEPGKTTVRFFSKEDFDNAVYDSTRFELYKPGEVKPEYFTDYMIVSDVEPGHSYGYNTWEKGPDGIYVEKYVAPYIPPAEPDKPVEGEIINSGTPGSGDASTSITVPSSTASDGKITSSIDADLANKLVESVVANDSKEVILDVYNSDSNTESVAVTLPSVALQKIADNTDADVIVKTETAEVKLDTAAVEEIAKQTAGGTVQISVNKVEETSDEVKFELSVTGSNGTTVHDFNGGTVSVTVPVPASLEGKTVVCVYIDEKGNYQLVEGSLNENGTYTFKTGHFSTYVLMTKEAAEKIIDEQNQAVKKKVNAATIKVVSIKGKGYIKLSWKTKSSVSIDGYEVYRGKTKASLKKWGSTKKTTYRNAKSLKKGTRYYYKVRGYKIIDGKKVYTKWSNINYRVAI